jgi:hypothetical protein
VNEAGLSSRGKEPFGGRDPSFGYFLGHAIQWMVSIGWFGQRKYFSKTLDHNPLAMQLSEGTTDFLF